MNPDTLRRQTAFHGALLFALGMFTGLYSAAALTGKVKVGIPHLALAAHLSALLGGLWLFALAGTLPLLRYEERGRRRLTYLTLFPTYGNWLITIVASLLGVRGIEFTGDRANDAIAVALQVIVVLPTLVATVAWAWGLRSRRNGSAVAVESSV